MYPAVFSGSTRLPAGHQRREHPNDLCSGFTATAPDGPSRPGRQGIGPYRSVPARGLIQIMNQVLSGRSARRSLKALVGVGDRIGLFTLPFLIVGLILNVP